MFLVLEYIIVGFLIKNIKLEMFFVICDCEVEKLIFFVYRLWIERSYLFLIMVEIVLYVKMKIFNYILCRYGIDYK